MDMQELGALLLAIGFVVALVAAIIFFGVRAGRKYKTSGKYDPDAPQDNSYVYMP